MEIEFWPHAAPRQSVSISVVSKAARCPRTACAQSAATSVIDFGLTAIVEDRSRAAGLKTEFGDSWSKEWRFELLAH